MVLSLSNVDLRRRSGAFGSGLVRIRDGRDELVDLLVPLAVWRGGVGVLLPDSSDGTFRQWPVWQGSYGGTVVAVGRRI